MSNALIILRDLAKDKVEESSKLLASARKELQASQDRLVMVQGYREQYQDGMTERAKQGVTGQQLQHQHQFIARLEDAILQQQRDVSFREQSVNAALTRWQLAQADEKKYQTLIDRADLAQQRKEAKREQKNNDEYAARIHRVGSGAY